MDRSFPPMSGVGTPPKWSHNTSFTPGSVITLYTVLSLSVSFDYELLEIRDLRSPVPRSLGLSTCYCMNKVVFPTHICPFNFLDSTCKMLYFFPIKFDVVAFNFSLYGF